MRLVWLALVVGCFDPKPPPGAPCSATSPCPGDQQCVAGTCDGVEPGPLGPDGAVQPDMVPPGGGDACDAAIPIAVDATSVAGSLAGAIDHLTTPSGCGPGNVDGIDVVYVFTIDQDGTSLPMSIKSVGFTGRYYTSTTCPAADFRQCGAVSPNGGGSTSVTFAAGKVFLVIERESGTGTELTIRP